MTKKEKLAEKEFKDIDQALHRAALKAKEEAERLGTPYVVADSNTKNHLQQHTVVDNKQ